VQALYNAGAEIIFTGHNHYYEVFKPQTPSGTVDLEIAVVSKILGHASISITADVVWHLVGTVASDAVNGTANLIALRSLVQEDVST
jgi:hypothetical protein